MAEVLYIFRMEFSSPEYIEGSDLHLVVSGCSNYKEAWTVATSEAIEKTKAYVGLQLNSLRYLGTANIVRNPNGKT